MGEYKTNLPAVRDEAGFTQEELVKGINLLHYKISKRHYLRFEYGELLPNIKLARIISGICDVPIEDIWGDFK